MVRPLIGVTAEWAEVSLHGWTTPHHVSHRAYIESVDRGGGLAVVVPLVDPQRIAGYLDHLDGIVVSGGIDIDPESYGAIRQPVCQPSQPERDEFERLVWGAIIERNLPTLGICRGLQSLNVACGGTLHQDLPDHGVHPEPEAGTHVVAVEPGSRLATLVGADHLATNSWHHQGVDELGSGLRVTGRAPDGVVEAIEVEAAPAVLAVQWHPELTNDRPHQLAFFTDLVARAAGS
ncbi:MAG: gamma-glutamyl-gamma-aminobutyrate hydrolase family protein [Actinomycetia bacterium]|nr:gamma-glutamyl-gamma-aminobutyrate hydrolase family protein [Actinomycetes bacterium]MCP4087569.1 gamma-glutamyl-gamma-aminobutyrate hydrolase family protein [Actinomycetes bacterium]